MHTWPAREAVKAVTVTLIRLGIALPCVINKYLTRSTIDVTS